MNVFWGFFPLNKEDNGLRTLQCLISTVSLIQNQVRDTKISNEYDIVP